MNQKDIDKKAKELFDILNKTDRPDIAYANIRNCLSNLVKEVKNELVRHASIQNEAK